MSSLCCPSAISGVLPKDAVNQEILQTRTSPKKQLPMPPVWGLYYAMIHQQARPTIKIPQNICRGACWISAGKARGVLFLFQLLGAWKLRPSCQPCSLIEPWCRLLRLKKVSPWRWPGPTSALLWVRSDGRATTMRCCKDLPAFYLVWQVCFKIPALSIPLTSSTNWFLVQKQLFL